jgi:hypothetical protein
VVRYVAPALYPVHLGITRLAQSEQVFLLRPTP